MKKKPRVLIAEFKHESNTFCHDKTGIKEFQEKYFLFGEELIKFFKGTKSEIGGFIDACQEEAEILPVLAANACPGGAVTREMFDLVKKNLLNKIREEKNIDAILLSLHGAMVLEDAPDGEGELLEEIRNLVGDNLPIMASLDMHANLTEKMIKNANGLFPYDNNPHTDLYERGYEAAVNIIKMIRKEIKPVLVMNKLPLLSSCLNTARLPHKEFLDMAHKWEKDPRVISVSILAGFNYADIYEAGMSVLAQTNNDLPLAAKIANKIGDAIMAKHQDFYKEIYSIEEAIKMGIESDVKPVILADVSDNPGGGSPGDGTEILKKLIEKKAQNVGFATIFDPETVEKAIKIGIRNTADFNIGGKSVYNLGKPITTKAIVKTIADGKFINKGPMGHGLMNDVGRTVVLGINGIEVIVNERRFQPLDPEIFRRVGIEPLEKQIIVLKSAMHYRAAYEKLARKIIEVDAPGVAPVNTKVIKLKNIRRPVFPLDRLDI